MRAVPGRLEARERRSRAGRDGDGTDRTAGRARQGRRKVRTPTGRCWSCPIHSPPAPPAPTAAGPSGPPTGDRNRQHQERSPEAQAADYRGILVDVERGLVTQPRPRQHRGRPAQPSRKNGTDIDLVGSGTGAVARGGSVSSPRPSNRACASRAHGLPTSFTGWHALPPCVRSRTGGTPRAG
jgi:hypothetical protein